MDEIIFEAQLIYNEQMPVFISDDHYITGLSNYGLRIQENIQFSDSDLVELFESDDCGTQKIKFKNFLPGSVVAFRYCIFFNSLFFQKCISRCCIMLFNFVQCVFGR